MIAAPTVFVGFWNRSDPLHDDGALEREWFARDHAHRLIRMVEPENITGSRHLAFAVMPSFDDWYAVAMDRPHVSRAALTIVRYQGADGIGPDARPVEIERESSAISPAAFDRFEQWFERWSARSRFARTASCADGTPVVWIDHTEKTARSGAGNCGKAPTELKQQLLAFAKRHARTVSLPSASDWHDRARGECRRRMQRLEDRLFDENFGVLCESDAAAQAGG